MFSYTALFALMETVKLLLFLIIWLDFSESSQGRNWNSSVKPVYLLLVIFECAMPMFGLFGLYLDICTKVNHIGAMSMIPA